MVRNKMLGRYILLGLSSTFLFMGGGYRRLLLNCHLAMLR